MLGNFTFHNPTKLHFGEEGLMRSLIVSSRKANVNPEDYEVVQVLKDSL